MRHIRYTIKETDGSEKIIIPIPESYRDCFTLIKSDYYRMYEHTDSIFKIWMKSHRSRSLKHLFWMRMASYKGWLYKFCILRHAHYRDKYDCSINAGTKIGYGLYIGHGMSLCVNSNSIIGNNVSISQFVNIGSNHGHAAIIHDGAYIAPMSCLVERVVIGTDAVIGAGSVVTRDVPARKTYAGSPAKQISENSNNHWHFYPLLEIPEENIEDIEL